MKKFTSFALWTLTVLSLIQLTGCAAGAATAVTAGYSLKAQAADSLTAEGEQRLVERIKKEISEENAKQS